MHLTKQNKTKISEPNLWSSALSHCWHVRLSPEAESAVKEITKLQQQSAAGTSSLQLCHSAAKPKSSISPAYPESLAVLMAVSKDWQTAATTDSEEWERQFEWTLCHSNTPAKAETQPLLLQCWQAAFESAGRKKP